MKELSIEEKAKVYDEAIERARKLKENPKTIFFEEENIHVSDYIFPELKESEDEKMWKLIKKYARYRISDMALDADHITRKQLLSWLEKQSKLNPYSGVSFEYNGHTWGMCARDNGVDILLDSQLLRHLEKQGQVKESSISQHENKTCKENSNSLTGKDEQKSADNIGPKFKVGDWITNGEYTWKVKDIKSLDYILQSQDGNIVDDTISFVDYNYFRLWSINDAKPGDVLVDIYNNIGIFQKCEGIYWQSWLYLGCNGELLGFSDGGCHKQTKTHPATKEQRDALKKAMADAGYIFDFEKKEVKKIEQKPAAWSEEDEMITLSIEQIINCASLLNIVPEKIDKIRKIRSWLKSLKERVM